MKLLVHDVVLDPTFPRAEKPCSRFFDGDLLGGVVIDTHSSHPCLRTNGMPKSAFR